MDDLEKRLKRIERQEGRSTSWTLRILLLLVLAGLGGLYYAMNAQDQKNIAQNGVLLPDVLIHQASASRSDLALLDRDLHELAVEADKHLSPHPGPGNHKRAGRYLERLDRLGRVGRGIEPNLTKEEHRVFLATVHAEDVLERFIRSSLENAPVDHAAVVGAEDLIARAQKLARGESTSAPLLPTALGGSSGLGNVGHEMKEISSGLKILEKSQAASRSAMPKDLLDVPELDGPKKKK